MKKKKICMLASSVILAIAIFSCTAFASSYTSTLLFQGEYTGATRHFDCAEGTGIYYSATTTASRYNSGATTYTVNLYRTAGLFGWGHTYIGQDIFDRYGFHSTIWTNVGEGDYYLYFTKARDNINVQSDDVIIRNQ